MVADRRVNFGQMTYDPFADLFQMVNDVSKQTSYPPYNIIKETDDKFVVELALAGFKKDEIKVETKQDKLTISGKKIHKVAEEGETVNYVHKGIGTRDFVREFVLSQYVYVKGANYQDGILTVKLEREVPEEKRPRVVDIE